MKVVDKVCYTPPKRKRGRPRKDDLLAACERGTRIKRRQSLPRSAKNNMALVVMEANSASDDDLSLGDYDSELGQSEPSQLDHEQDTYIEVALTDEDHVQDAMQSVHSGTSLPDGGPAEAKARKTEEIGRSPAAFAGTKAEKTIVMN
ncbi:hypothetical protein ANCCAN_12525 [Ancylostoma caninum]|uniref:Uncharacterized protein n=1 Tax=Ancylostoma caninum TaxID=29170 RepID=A0A368GFD9_ANCCA|nr:hypothetical protein ANCCAN_12525 [Ancylostoma caninum]